MSKNNMFENALTALPWETFEDLKKLLSLGAKVKEKDAPYLLGKAVRLNNLEVLDTLLKMTGGVRALRRQDAIDSPGKNEYKILSEAMSEDVGLPVLQKLVESGFNINAGRSPLLHRKLESEYGFRLCALDEEKRQPWSSSLMPAGEGSTEKMAYLMSKGLKPYEYKEATRKDLDKIFECIHENDVKGLAAILATGVSPNGEVDMNDAYYSPLAEAYFSNRRDIARVLLFAGAVPTLSGRTYTLCEFLNGRVFNFQHSGKDREAWEVLASQEALLREKYPYMYSSSVAESRKKVLNDILSASSKEKALEVARKFHEKHPKQKTALKFTSRPQKTAG